MRRYLLVALALVLIPAAAGIFAVANHAPPAAADDTGTLQGTVNFHIFPVINLTANIHGGSLSVRATHADNTTYLTTMDPTNAQYAFAGLPVGAYTVRVENGIVLSPSVETTVEASVVSVADINIAPVSGLVQGDIQLNGAPLAGAIIRDVPTGLYVFVANAAGEFSLLFPAGTHSFDVFTSANAYVGTTPSFVINAGLLTNGGTIQFGQLPAPCTNTSANFIDLSPPKTYDDLSAPNSDTLCDDVDDDDDNDAISDADELTGAACNGTITNPLLADTDGDHALDNAECALGTDPTDGTANEPTAAQCIAATSAGTPDSDGIVGWREYCYYNTDHTVINTDGDTRANGAPSNDGCEVYSMNVSPQITVTELQQISVEFGNYGPPPADYPNNSTYRVKVNFDVTKDGAINVADLQQTAAAIAICL